MTPGRTRAEIVPTLPRHVVGVAGVVLDDQRRVLLVKRRDEDVWEFPGGALEPGERLLDGLVREVEEETGLIVQPLALSGVYQNLTLGPIALVFRCRRVSGTERITAETQEWRWVQPDQLSSLLAPAWAVRAVDALDNPEDTPVRLHDGVQVVSSLPEALPAPEPR